jgi:hypothetical protein
MSLDRFIELRRLIEAADSQGLVAGSPDLSGYSGARLVGMLQRLAARPTSGGGCYLEVGVFRGMTLLSVAAVAGDIEAFGIDNFSQFDPEGRNRDTVLGRMSDLGISNAQLVDEDFELALERLADITSGRKIATYFVDGPHDYRSQLLCLELAREQLAEDAVIVVDDSNYQHVRQASADFLRLNPGFKLFFQAYTGAHPANLDADAVAQAREGWWNGITVIVADPDDVLERTYPPTDRDRTLFVNDHVVQGTRLARHSPRAMRLAAALFYLQPVNLVRQWLQLYREYRAQPARSVPKFEMLNTYSEDLRYPRFNPALPEK